MKNAFSRLTSRSDTAEKRLGALEDRAGGFTRLRHAERKEGRGPQNAQELQEAVQRPDRAAATPGTEEKEDGAKETLEEKMVEGWTSLVAQMVKRLSTVRETRVQALGWEDPLEKEMAIHSRAIAWKIPWKEEPGRLQSIGSQTVGHD